jgi:hypothetical protein
LGRQPHRPYRIRILAIVRHPNWSDRERRAGQNATRRYGHDAQGIEPIDHQQGRVDLVRVYVSDSDRRLQALAALAGIEVEQLVEHLLTPRVAAVPSPEHVSLLPSRVSRQPRGSLEAGRWLG